MSFLGDETFSDHDIEGIIAANKRTMKSIGLEFEVDKDILDKLTKKASSYDGISNRRERIVKRASKSNYGYYYIQATVL
jgi:hypothetical protein